MDNKFRSGREPEAESVKIDPQAFKSSDLTDDTAKDNQPIETISLDAADSEAEPESESNQTNEDAAKGQTTDKEEEKTTSDAANNKTKTKESSKSNKKNWKFWSKWSKKRKIITLVIAGLVLIVGSLVTWQLTKSQPVEVVKVDPPKKIVPPPVYYSNLSGLKIKDNSANKRPVTAVMIENSLDARPQSGLSHASIVYEAIAEGGITRFLALFQDKEPANVGPIRSARPYFVQWANGYDANYAHVGGSPEALRDIKKWGIRDIDQFYNSGYYHRINSRYAPHNMYSSLKNLRKAGKARGFGSSNFTGFERKPESPSKKPTAGKINLNISSYNYNDHYDYSAASNSYKRVMGGKAHIDKNTSKQITPKNVVALITSYGLESDGYHSQYKVTGSGPVYAFMDGKVVQGTWHKSSLEGPLTLKDQTGQSIKLNRGQTWITTLSNSGQVKYLP